MKAVVAAFNQEKALVGAFSVITNLRMELFEALAWGCQAGAAGQRRVGGGRGGRGHRGAGAGPERGGGEGEDPEEEETRSQVVPQID